MGLTEVQAVPHDAEHESDSDLKLPDGRTVRQFRTEDGRVFESVSKRGERTRYFRLDPDRGERVELDRKVRV